MTEPTGPLAALLGDEPRRTAAGELLDFILRHPMPPPERRVFVNRTLRLDSIRHVGFDLDWTLADYERLPLERLTFELARDRLIAHHGYPDGVRAAEFRPDFPCRGLLIDKLHGTVLRMNRHRYVGQAYLGRRRLDSDELIGLYRKEPVEPGSGRYYHVDSLFELGETNLFAELVELAGRKPTLGLPGYGELFADVRASIDWVHAEGPLKRRVLADPATYLRRDPEIGHALGRLALGGRRMILLTNSDWPYVDGLCSYLFDGLVAGRAAWRELFDLVIVRSGKPRFFKEDRPFVVVDGPDAGARVDRPDWGGVYAEGSHDGLMRLLDCRGERMLYVGDHIYGDVVSSKRQSTWRTALIVGELEEEFRRDAEHAHDHAELGGLRRRIADLGHQMDRIGDLAQLNERLEALGETRPEQASAMIGEVFERMRGEHRALLGRARRMAERVDAAYNPYWGPFFKQGSSKTLFAAQMEGYACLYTSRASNFGFYGSSHYFRVLDDPMTHESDG